MEEVAGSSEASMSFEDMEAFKKRVDEVIQGRGVMCRYPASELLRYMRVCRGHAVPSMTDDSSVVAVE